MTDIINRSWLNASINMGDKNAKYENDKRLQKISAKKYQGTSAPIVKNNLSSRQRYNGAMGNLKYSTDTSVKVPPTILNKYNEEYESGRRTILVDTTNKYNINVSGYIYANKNVKRHASNRYEGINVVGRF